ncbi:hypothetical protein [Rhizobium rhizoryzae]|uniref:hypothetical protein n=1 Tax=Rhizobium rhizoryzae TaxID=451876 RepID=UPI0028AE1C4B|nr:hypothetical protein [Rhizobium rhizoryzae]
MHAIAKDDYVEVTLMIGKLMGPIFEPRKNEARRHFKRALMKTGAEGYISEVSTALIPGELSRRLHHRLRNIDERLMAIIEAPVPPRVVEKCLGITGRERSRWMKDGRLPSCARHRSNRTEASFSVPYFPAQLVDELCKHPDIVSRWREMDGNVG